MSRTVAASVQRSASFLSVSLEPAMAARAADQVPPTLAAAHYKVLYIFHGTTDGDTPNGKLVVDSPGNLYGTASGGGMRPKAVGWAGSASAASCTS